MEFDPFIVEQKTGKMKKSKALRSLVLLKTIKYKRFLCPENTSLIGINHGEI